MKPSELTTLSLFSGAMGLDLGLEAAGFDVRAAVECNQHAVQTVSDNRPDIKVIAKKIENVSPGEVLELAGLTKGEPVVISGGPSCQPFSTAGQRGSINDPRGSLFREFIRMVKEIQPRFFVMENVKGILSAAVKHRSLKQRGPGFPELEPEEQLGSAFLIILEEFKALGYYVIFDLVNAADYGVPQSRERLICIGSRDGEPIEMPSPTHSRHGQNGLPRWNTLQSALGKLDDENPLFRPFSQSVCKYLELIPAGGNWRNLPEDMQEIAIGSAYHSWGGRVGFLRRLSWSKPAPALTTDPNGRATMLCHPDEIRPLTVKEYAALQQFPHSWDFSGALAQQYIQIGNAVPVGLGEAIGRAIIEAMTGRIDSSRVGQVICKNQKLIERLANRPRTQLNPPHMREASTPDAVKKWLGNLPKLRAGIRAYGEQLPLPSETHIEKVDTSSCESVG